MYPVLLDIGGLQIRTYGVLVGAAVLLGIHFASKHLSRFGISSDDVWNTAVWAILFGIAGARLAFVIQHWDYFSRNLTEIPAVWHGGLTFYGVILGAVPILWKLRKERWDFWVILDATVPAVALGLAVGRWGCFFNGCCYGKPTDLPWGVVYPPGSDPHLHFGDVPLHPSQIYESVGDALLFLFYLYMLRRVGVKRPGVVGALALVLTPLVRFFVDFTRVYEPNAYVFGLTFNQWIALTLSSMGLILLYVRMRVEHKTDPT